MGGRMGVPVLLGEHLPNRGLGEPEPGQIAVAARAGAAADEYVGQRVLPQHLVEVGGDEHRDVDQTFDETEQTGADVPAGQAERWRQACQVVQVVALVQVAAQGAGQAGDDRLRRVRATGLLQPRVVVRGHARQLCDLFPAESRRTAARTLRQADVGGPEQLAAPAEEVGQAVTIDHTFHHA